MITSENKPRTAKVGAISKAQNLKGGPFGLCETPAGCKKFEKKLKGDPLGTWKNFPKKFFNEIFEQCHSAEKCKRGDPLRFFDIHCVAKYRNKWRGDPLVQSKKLQKKCWKKVGLRCVFEVVDVCFVFSFRFGRASEVGVVEVWSCWSLRLLNKWTKKWTFRV